jgi:hypothetical protein
MHQLLDFVAPRLETLEMILTDSAAPQTEYPASVVAKATNLTNLHISDGDGPFHRVGLVLDLDLSNIRHLTLATYQHNVSKIAAATGSLVSLSVVLTESRDLPIKTTLLPDIIKDIALKNKQLVDLDIVPNRWYGHTRSFEGWYEEYFPLIEWLPGLTNIDIDLNQQCLDRLGIPLTALRISDESAWSIYVLTCDRTAPDMQLVEKLYELCHSGFRGIKRLAQTILSLPDAIKSDRGVDLRPLLMWALEKVRKQPISSDIVCIQVVTAFVALADATLAYSEYSVADLHDMAVSEASNLIAEHKILRSDIDIRKSRTLEELFQQNSL